MNVADLQRYILLVLEVSLRAACSHALYYRTLKGGWLLTFQDYIVNKIFQKENVNKEVICLLQHQQ